MLRAQALADLFNQNLDASAYGIFLTTTSGALVGHSTTPPSPNTTVPSITLIKKACVLGSLTWRHEIALLQASEVASAESSSQPQNHSTSPASSNDPANPINGTPTGTSSALLAATSTPLHPPLSPDALDTSPSSYTSNPLLAVIHRRISSTATNSASTRGPSVNGTPSSSAANNGPQPLQNKEAPQLKTLLVEVQDRKSTLLLSTVTSTGIGAGNGIGNVDGIGNGVSGGGNGGEGRSEGSGKGSRKKHDVAISSVGMGLLVGVFGPPETLSDASGAGDAGDETAGAAGAAGVSREYSSGTDREDSPSASTGPCSGTGGTGAENGGDKRREERLGNGRERERTRALIAKAEGMAEFLAKELGDGGFRMPGEMMYG